MKSEVAYVKTTEGKVNGAVAVNRWRCRVRWWKIGGIWKTIAECIVGLAGGGNVLETRVA